MTNLVSMFTKYATPRNRKVLYILLTLAALAIAGGAPSAGSGLGSGPGPDIDGFFGW